jgi:hypothetical protein
LLLIHVLECEAPSNDSKCSFFIQEVKTDTAKTDTSEKIPEKQVTTPSKDEEVKDTPAAEEVDEKVKKSPKKEAPKKKTKPVEETKKPQTPKRKKAESDENEESSTKQSNFIFSCFVHDNLIIVDVCSSAF